MIVLHVAEQVSALQFVVSSTLLEVRVLVIVCVCTELIELGSSTSQAMRFHS